MTAKDQVFDSRFLAGVYGTGIVLWCLGSALLATKGLMAVAGFALGGALSLVLLVAQERMVRALLGRPGRRPVRRFLWLSLLKYPAICAAIGLALRYQVINPLALCAGILLVPAAMSLQAATMALRGSRKAEPGKS